MNPNDLTQDQWYAMEIAALAIGEWLAKAACCNACGTEIPSVYEFAWPPHVPRTEAVEALVNANLALLSQAPASIPNA